eukprot:CAMPEP_0179155580 /NCGR_PEP_ID=MMETSP0796-20121207/75794_1 /TAXON_ID=73915 /ORGANISM="Pyrodinium bahamense, Strain pbaha01" /LENGTH=62 /DNA_ID=CAMNT_0020857077 /DNA_START=14 /DNA_END=199 /DNA_ORIENTATION=+
MTMMQILGEGHNHSVLTVAHHCLSAAAPSRRAACGLGVQPSRNGGRERQLPGRGSPPAGRAA